MSLLDTISSPAGLYVLNARGELGYFDAEGKPLLDTELSLAFASHNRDFLKLYLADPAAERRRLAIIYKTVEPNPWGPVTFFLEEFVVRELYPVGGKVSGGLTGFQQKNRAKSVYRGMEVLLEARSDVSPNCPVFCPVLLDRKTRLAQYADVLGHEPSQADQASAVVEVVNLVATIPLARRETEAVLKLRERLASGIVRKDQRREKGFGVLEGPDHWMAQGSADDAFADLDRDTRLGRDLTLSAEDLAKLHESEHLDKVERWLVNPLKPVDAGTLRRFARFKDLDESVLVALAARTFLYAAPPGARLLDRGLSDAWNMFLLEGKVMLTPEDGTGLLLEGGTENAAFPVSFLKPRKYNVDAQTPVSFIWVHDLQIYAATGGG
jgi:hypothetical protein